MGTDVAKHTSERILRKCSIQLLGFEHNDSLEIRMLPSDASGHNTEVQCVCILLVLFPAVNIIRVLEWHHNQERTPFEEQAISHLAIIRLPDRGPFAKSSTDSVLWTAHLFSSSSSSSSTSTYSVHVGIAYENFSVVWIRLEYTRSSDIKSIWQSVPQCATSIGDNGGKIVPNHLKPIVFCCENSLSATETSGSSRSLGILSCKEFKADAHQGKLLEILFMHDDRQESQPHRPVLVAEVLNASFRWVWDNPKPSRIKSLTHTTDSLEKDLSAFLVLNPRAASNQVDVRSLRTVDTLRESRLYGTCQGELIISSIEPSKSGTHEVRIKVFDNPITLVRAIADQQYLCLDDHGSLALISFSDMSGDSERIPVATKIAFSNTDKPVACLCDARFLDQTGTYRKQDCCVVNEKAVLIQHGGSVADLQINSSAAKLHQVTTTFRFCLENIQAAIALCHGQLVACDYTISGELTCYELNPPISSKSMVPSKPRGCQRERFGFILRGMSKMSGISQHLVSENDQLNQLIRSLRSVANLGVTGFNEPSNPLLIRSRAFLSTAPYHQGASRIRISIPRVSDVSNVYTGPCSLLALVLEYDQNIDLEEGWILVVRCHDSVYALNDYRAPTVLTFCLPLKEMRPRESPSSDSRFVHQSVSREAELIVPRGNIFLPLTVDCFLSFSILPHMQWLPTASSSSQARPLGMVYLNSLHIDVLSTCRTSIMAHPSQHSWRKDVMLYHVGGFTQMEAAIRLLFAGQMFNSHVDLTGKREEWLVSQTGAVFSLKLRSRECAFGESCKHQAEVRKRYPKRVGDGTSKRWCCSTLEIIVSGRAEMVAWVRAALSQRAIHLGWSVIASGNHPPLRSISAWIGLNGVFADGLARIDCQGLGDPLCRSVLQLAYERIQSLYTAWRSYCAE